MNQGRNTDTSNQPANKKMKSSTSAVESYSSTKTTTPNKKGTIYITIGPQCAGKTTILKCLFGQSFHKNEEDIVSTSTGKSTTRKEEGGVDITIDDQKLVYIPVATSYFLYNNNASSNTNNNNNNNNNSSSNTSSFPSLNSTVYDKTIRERINDPSNAELTLVTQRLGGTLTSNEFAARIRQQQGTNNGRRSNGSSSNTNTTVQEDLINAVEHTIQLNESSKSGGEVNDVTSTLLPEKIDLFIVESIFQPRPMKLMQRLTSNNSNSTKLQSSSSSETVSALDQSIHLLKSYATDNKLHSTTAPLSSGNTNTRPREFQNALEAAKISNRPVEFIVFGGNEACEMICQNVSRREYRAMPHEQVIKNDDDAKGKDSTALLCLPKVNRRTLFLRNINRFVETGRYIPSQAIDDAMVRVESMLANAVAEANKRVSNSNEECMKTTSMEDAKFLLDCELAKLAGYRLNANRTVTGGNTNNSNNNGGRRYESGRGNNNNRNNYQSGRGGNNSRYQQRPGRYGSGRDHYQGRGRHNYGESGGYSNSHSGNGWDDRR